MSKRWIKAAAIAGVVLLLGAVPASFGFVYLTVRQDLAAFPELRAFSQIAFGTETGFGGNEERVSKWTDPIVFATAGPKAASLDTYVTDYFRSLADITGLHISAAQAAEAPPNFTIRSLAPAEIADAIAAADWQDHTRRFLHRFAETDMPCVFATRTDGGRIFRAEVFLKDDLSRSQAEFCIQEEVAQALGLPNDTDAIADTVFNDINDVMHLTPLDERLLHLLYLDEVKPGMSRILALYRLGKYLRDACS